MITIANCLDLSEVQHLRIALESAGIPIYVPDELTATVAPFQFFSNTGIRIQVAEEYAEQAHAVVAQARALS
jgi:hypothetical protein